MNPARLLIGLTAAAMTATLTGCAASPRVRPEPAAERRGEARPAESTQTPEELADQARRDVEAILQATEKDQAPPVIQWQRDASSTVAAAPGDSKPRFAPGPLFRVMDEAPAVSSPPPPPTATVRTTEPNSTPAASGIAEALATDDADQLAVELARELYRRSSYDDVPLRQLLVIAALSITDPERDLSPEAIPGLTERERETLEHFQAFCRTLGHELGNAADADAVLVEALNALRDDLVEPPRLSLPTATLCFHVDGFGRFRAFDRNSFLANSGQQVILYLEIGDFTSELDDKGQWVTELSQQLVIYSDTDGIPVWKADWQAAVDATRNKRQDFFTVQVITLPDALGVGRYHLKVRVRDEKSGAEAEMGIQFEMVADAGLAASAKP